MDETTVGLFPRRTIPQLKHRLVSGGAYLILLGVLLGRVLTGAHETMFALSVILYALAGAIYVGTMVACARALYIRTRPGFAESAERPAAKSGQVL